jgi:hypothetical protein
MWFNTGCEGAIIFLSFLQAISKTRLRPHGGVASRLKMLTYYVYAALFRRPAPCPEP